MVTVYRNGNAYVPKHLSKDQDIPISVGDTVAVATPGGGGYGDPVTRDPKLVFNDVRLGYYTAEQARDLFGVALLANHAGVDTDATELLRNAGGSEGA